jgi:hypothetical protein
MIPHVESGAMTPARARSAVNARWARILFAAALLATLAGCYTYVLLPGEVTYEKVSPAYVLHIVNRTGTAFSIEPSAYGQEKGFPVQPVANGAGFDVLMQVRSFRLGERDRIGGHQVFDGPYIAQEGASTAVIRIRHRELYLLTVDLESDLWFAARTSAAPLELALDNFEPKRWFRTGPLQNGLLPP